jgi:acyl-CoA thioester hydrolase
MNEMAEGAAHLLADGTILTNVTLRYSDMDMMGHLNNAVYATLFEAGRVAYIDGVLGDLTPEGAGYVIVKLTVEFKAEARFPGTARVSTRIVKLGGSSMTYLQVMTVNGREVASAESICALFDRAARKAMRCPEALRQHIRKITPDLATA